MLVPFLKPGQTPDPVSLGGPLYTAMVTALITQEEQMAEEIRELCHWQDCLAQEAEKAEKERDRMCNWVHDLMDQRHNVKAESGGENLSSKGKKKS